MIGPNQSKPNHSPSSDKKYRNIQLFLRVIGDGEPLDDIPAFIGKKRQARLTALLGFIGSTGVPIEDATKFLMREFFSSHDLASKDLRDLEYSGLLRKEEDRMFAVRVDETDA